MATLLDIGLLNVFGVIFPFLFIWALVYGFLTTIKVFEGNKSLIAIIATSLAFLTLFSRIAVKTINVMAPWFVLFFVMIMLSLMVYYAFGVKPEKITESLMAGEHKLGFYLLAIVLIIALGSFFSVLSEEKGVAKLREDGSMAAPVAGQEKVETAGFIATITHPKVLGMALVLLIAVITMSYLAGEQTPSGK